MNLSAMKQAAEAAMKNSPPFGVICDPQTILKIIAVIEAATVFVNTHYGSLDTQRAVNGLDEALEALKS